MSDGGRIPKQTQRIDPEAILEAINKSESKGIPVVSFTSTETAQRLIQEEPNRIRIEGAAAAKASPKAVHRLTLDDHVLELEVDPGEGPLAVASRVRALLPKGYTVTVKTGRPATAYAVISFWRQ